MENEEFGSLFNQIFGAAMNVIYVTKINRDGVIRSLNEKFRAAIFDPGKNGEYEAYLTAVKRSGTRVFRDKSGSHKLILKED